MTDSISKATRLKSILKKADMMCSAHANLGDRYARRALILESTILIASAYIAAHAFGSEVVIDSISPFGMPYQLWLGIASVAVFAMSLLQLCVSWKEKSSAHRRSFASYSEVKHDVAGLLASSSIDNVRADQVLARYALAGESGTTIPEAEFLKQKRKHKSKIEISNYIDEHPGASVRLSKCKLFLRDNFGWDVLSNRHGNS